MEIKKEKMCLLVGVGSGLFFLLILLIPSAVESIVWLTMLMSSGTGLFLNIRREKEGKNNA